MASISSQNPSRFFGVVALTSVIATGSHAAVTISASQTQNMSCSAGVCAPTASDATLNVTDLENLLAAGNVEITTTGSGAQADDVDIAAPVSWSNANALALDAYRSISVSQPVTVGGASAISIVTNDGGSDGTLSFVTGGNLSFESTRNVLAINGEKYKLESSIAALAKHIAKNPSGQYALSSSYDASRDGTYKASPIKVEFNGTFIGLGNTIANLTIDSKKENIGLFAEISSTGVISSVELTNVAIDAKVKVGGYIGSIVGENLGVVSNIFTSGKIRTNSHDTQTAGGLVGFNAGDILASASSTSVSASSHRQPTSAIIGGLAGQSDGAIADSFADGSVSSSAAAYAGGLAGIDGGAIQNCYATGSVASSASYSFVGGLVGYSGTVASISDSYSTGSASVQGSNTDLGGFLGYDAYGTDDMSNDYWDTTTSGVGNLSQGVGNIANDPGVTGLSTAQLQAGLPTGFDPSVWAENADINGGLPYLIANPPQ